MKRPFAIIGSVSFMVAVILSGFGMVAVSTVGVAALAVFLCFLVLCLRFPRFKILCAAAFAVAVISISLLFTMKNYETLSSFNKSEVDFTGTVTRADYYTGYERVEIKLSEINGQKENVYLVLYDGDKTGLSEGDEISARASVSFIPKSEADAKTAFANKRYFTANHLENLECTGTNKYYKTVYSVKNAYKQIIKGYLPNELGTVAVGMTIGDRGGMSTRLRNCFNFSGTAHLLVVSGLHLTIWVMLISRLVPLFRKRKLLDFVASAVFTLLYLSLTGFSVSVVRAGIMLMVIKLSRTFKRGFDSINSLGLAVTVLLIINPYSVNSTSFLLSVTSTLGLILFAEKAYVLICKCKVGRVLAKSFLGKLAVSSLSVSISVSVFTLPVFILKLDMFPLLSFVSNIIIVYLAEALMIFTVIGAIMTLSGLETLANILFYFAGLLARAVTDIAEKIGMLSFSTAAVSSRFFRCFLAFAAVASIVILLLIRFKGVRKFVLPVAVSVSLAFTLLASTGFEAAHPSVDVMISDGAVCVLLRDGNSSILTGTHQKHIESAVGAALGRHNLKNIGCVYAPVTNDLTPSEINQIMNTYKTDKLIFKDNMPSMSGFTHTAENADYALFAGRFTVTPVSAKTVKIKCDEKDIFISCENSCEKLFEFDEKYDIIILYTQSFEQYSEEAGLHLKNESSVLLRHTGSDLILYPDCGKIYSSENF